MLVLSRKKGEKIVISDVVTVVVIEIRGDKVRLGIEAPPEVSVHRQEVYDAIRRKTPPDRDVPPMHPRSSDHGPQHGLGELRIDPPHDFDDGLGAVPDSVQ